MNSLALFIFYSTGVVQAEGCGDIIYLGDNEGEEIRLPIENCDDPFSLLDPSFNLTVAPVYTLAGEVLDEGASVATELPTGLSLSVDSIEPYILSEHSLFLHEGQDYREMENGLNYDFTITDPGTYTVVATVMTEIGGGLSEDAISLWLRSFRDVILPTAHAQVIELNFGRAALTFTVEEEQISGASSVLFLPGIMGSRLSEVSEDCDQFTIIPYTQVRWPSSDGCDIARLDMSPLGISENDIFTKPEGGVIEDIAGFVNLYESLLEDLRDWKDDELIADYLAVPYDWRLSLYDILTAREIDGEIVPDTSGDYQAGYVYKSLVELIEVSPKKKVTLVGHSNGGLVIQALLATMKANDDPLLLSIDKVVLVAVPQVGTPESVVGVLHGVAMGPFGTYISHEESRRLMNTSPFGYHLLPSYEYYDMVETPVISFESGTSTDTWIEEFGKELDSLEETTAFLAKESGRETPKWSDTATPATLHSHLLGYANSVHDYLEDWRPDDTIVYEVGGVGIPTPAELTYFTDMECVRRVQTHFSTYCTEFESKLGYRVKEVIDGDGTVVVPSAMAVAEGSGVEKWWLDFLGYNDENSTKNHSNIMEVEEVRDLISAVVSSGDVGSYSYLSTSYPDISNENRLLLRLHSPLDLYVTLQDGEVVGSTTPILRGVEYRRYGEVQQLSIPEGEGDYQIHLIGLADGSFTLDIEQYDGEELEERVTYSAQPTSTSTKVTISIVDEDVLSEVSLHIDYDGDGIFETTALPGLAKVTFTTSEPTTTVSKSKSTGTKVKKSQGLAAAPAGALTMSTIEDEKAELELLRQFVELLTQYRDLLIWLRLQ